MENELTKECKAQLEKLHSLHYDYATFSQKDGFQSGFRLAMLMMLEVSAAKP